MSDGRHARFRALGLATLAIGVLPWAFSTAVADPAQLAGTYLGWATAMYLFAAGGTLVSAFTFGGGEPMRPGWLVLCLSYLVLVPVAVAAGPKAAGLHEGLVRLPWLITLASVTSGFLAIVAFVLLSRAWRASGLDPSTRAMRVVARLVAVVVAVALAGPDLVERFPAAVQGDVIAIGDVITDLLDASLFVVAVPVLRAALALGGGVAAWPWVLLTASLASWLGYDATTMWGGAAGLEPRTIRIADEVLRTLGAGFAFSAGIAQRWVMTARRVGE